jgi:hypothetical protein
MNQEDDTFGILVGCKSGLILLFIKNSLAGEFGLFRPFLNLSFPGLGLCRAVGIEFILTAVGGLDCEV